MLPKGYYWMPCPKCGNPHMQVVRKDTVLVNFPGYCKMCKTESLVNKEPKRQVANS